jgi:hypothetical protein
MAAVNAETLALFTEDLSIYEPADVAKALDKFGKSIPEQYEPAFPCIGVFLKKVESVVNQRKREERERKEKLEEQERARLHEEDRRLNPEKYAAAEKEMDERIAALEKKFLFSKKATPTTI